MVQDRQTRIVSIDIIRGFAIFGIFLVNMISFHSPFLYLDPSQWWEGRLDQITYIMIDVFAQASFYPLFSLLFGYSFVWLRDKAILQGLSFPMMAFRRLIFLLGVGLIHAFFIWHGDILYQYAILGFFLLFFLHLSGRTLLFSGLSLYGIPTIGFNLLLTFVPTNGLDIYDQQKAELSLSIYQNGTFSEITTQRITDWQLTNSFENFPFMVISIFSLFLIGAGVAKLKWLENPDLNQKTTYVLVITSVVGILVKLSPYLFTNDSQTQYLQDSIGGISLAFAYALIIFKIAKHKWMQPLAYIGRMSISNYLLQSVLSTFLFYQYGLGMYGKISLFTGTILATVIFIFQIMLSQYWLKRYRYGPVEWIWRCMTYLKVINNKVKSNQSA
jgi:uncharacterized protein